MNSEINLFNNKGDELGDILKRVKSFCETYGYSALRIYADKVNSEYVANAFGYTDEMESIVVEINPKKPRRVTLEEIEEKFGCPIEIVP